MSKEKNQSNKKNTTKKKTNNKVTDTKLTKATKEKKEKKSNIKILDTMDEEFEEINMDEEFEEINMDEEFISNDYDEDLDEEVELIIDKPSKPKKKDENNTSEEKIKKIEKLAKEKKAKTAKNNKKLENCILFFNKHSQTIGGFIAGIVITTLIAIIIWPDRIAALKNGEEPIVKVGSETYTADELYKSMKDYYSVSLLLDDIDNDLLTKLYPETDEMTEEINSNAEYYLNMYEQYYGYTEEQFLSANGFASYNAFLDYLRLDYRRNKYLDKYLEDNLTDDEIKKYYEKNVFGDINTQHVLVEIKEESDEDKGLTDEEAKKLAEEIITKLNDGTSWESIQKDYKDKITYEDLGYQSWDASLEESFMTALKEMEDNTYSEEPVKTSYGYHVIYRIDQKEAPTLKEAKETIIENLLTDKKAEDSNLLYKALISLREEKKIDFKDTNMKEKYNEYCKKYK